MPDALQELIAGARGPLLFLRDAAPEKRAHIQLPVQAWLARIESLGGDGVGLGRLADGLRALADADAPARQEAVHSCLAALDELASGGLLSAAAGAAAVPEAPAAAA
ncbi:MAG: hypothetical protein VCC00_07360, partial [Deltaproteobacteria bacterium]